jgi:Pre ATP-grasp domain
LSEETSRRPRDSQVPHGSHPAKQSPKVTSVAPPGAVQRILVHSAASGPGTTELRACLPAYQSYDQRALLMANQADIVCVLGEVEATYANYLHELGIGPDPKNIVSVTPTSDTVPQATLTETLLENSEALAQLAERVTAAVPLWLEPFIAGRCELELANRLGGMINRKITLVGAPAVAEQANRKDVQRRWAQELDVPVPEGEIVVLELGDLGRIQSVEPLQMAIERQLRAGNRVLVRGCIGASGSATRIVAGNDVDSALAWAAGRTDDTVYLVDKLYTVRASPSVLFFVEPEGGRSIQFIGATDQILDESLRHIGNQSPSRAVLIGDMIGYAERLTAHLCRNGYIGWIGFDFCEYIDQQTGRPKVFLAEVNPRITGASYPVRVATHWAASDRNLGVLLSANVRTPARSFKEVAERCSRHLLRRDHRAGALPYNTGCLAHGYCAVMVLDETLEAAQHRWRRVAAMLRT